MKVKVKERHTRINENGRVVIPASFRRALGIHPGEAVVLRLEDDELRITTLRQRLAKAQQLVRAHVPPTTSLADEIIAERREVERRE
jgi:AbrB family looped-hinge helix DNA binding protein